MSDNEGHFFDLTCASLSDEKCLSQARPFYEDLFQFASPLKLRTSRTKRGEKTPNYFISARVPQNVPQNYCNKEMKSLQINKLIISAWNLVQNDPLSYLNYYTAITANLKLSFWFAIRLSALIQIFFIRGKVAHIFKFVFSSKY